MTTLIESLRNEISKLDGMPKLTIGSLSKTSGFAIEGIAGSKVLVDYMDGAQVISMPVQVAMRSNDTQRAIKVLSDVSNFIDDLKTLPSDGTWQFENSDIEPQPFANGMTIENEGVFLVEFTITVRKDKLEQEKDEWLTKIMQ